MKYVIYLITNTASNKFYIGQTRRELKRRWADYNTDLLKPVRIKKRTGCNIHLRRSTQKCLKNLGHTDFLLFTVLDIIDPTNSLLIDEKQKLLNEREVYWIHHYRSKHGYRNVYNIKDGGTVPKSSFSKDPEATRTKLSQARRTFLASESGKLTIAQIRQKLIGRASTLKGTVISEEHREKIRKATQGTNNPNYGKQHTEETKKKIGDKNRQLSEEARKARSEALKGKTPFNKGKTWNELYDSETIERMKMSVVNSNKRRIISEETRKICSLRNKGRKWGKHSDEQKQRWKEQRKNLSYVERYGEEKADEIKRKLQNITKQRFTKTFDLSNNPLISPTGELYLEIIGLNEFAKTHKLHPRLLKEVIIGKRKTHKGWHLDRSET